MAVNLVKGQKISLTKEASGLSNIMVGLGWDPAKKGLLGGLFGSSDFDLDASVFVLIDDKIVNSNDIVYYNHLKHESGAIIHCGDNLTGGGDGDDEQIKIDLSKIPERYNKLVFVVNIYQCDQRHQNFGMVKNAFIRVVNSTTNTEIAKYNLTDDYSNETAMIFGEIYRKDGEWKFSAVGQGTTDTSISELAKRYK